MKSLHTTKSGQAAVELAIFGTLILLAFSVLLMYGQNLDNQQQVKMEAFRRALQKSYERNGSVSYTLKKEGRAFNLFSGYAQGQPATSGSTASVLWQKGQPGGQGTTKSEGYAYNAINDVEIGSLADGTGLPRYPKRTININGTEQTTYVTPSTYLEDQVRSETYDSQVTKDESSGRIVNTRIAKLTDTLTSTPHVRVDISKSNASKPHEVVLPEYVYDDGTTYDNEGTDIAVAPIEEVTLGAYATDDNRVTYKKQEKDAPSNEIIKQRTWETANP
jgi:hypothetical protein